MPHPRLAYPSLRLAQRALPRRDGRGSSIWPAESRAAPPRSLGRDRPARPPLRADERPSADAPASLAARWERWRPERWRLDVAYGDVALPVALARYARTVIARRGTAAPADERLVAREEGGAGPVEVEAVDGRRPPGSAHRRGARRVVEHRREGVDETGLVTERHGQRALPRSGRTPTRVPTTGSPTPQPRPRPSTGPRGAR